MNALLTYNPPGWEVPTTETPSPEHPVGNPSYKIAVWWQTGETHQQYYADHDAPEDTVKALKGAQHQRGTWAGNGTLLVTNVKL